MRAMTLSMTSQLSINHDGRSSLLVGSGGRDFGNGTLPLKVGTFPAFTLVMASLNRLWEFSSPAYMPLIKESITANAVPFSSFLTTLSIPNSAVLVVVMTKPYWVSFLSQFFCSSGVNCLYGRVQVHSSMLVQWDLYIKLCTLNLRSWGCHSYLSLRNGTILVLQLQVTSQSTAAECTDASIYYIYNGDFIEHAQL